MENVCPWTPSPSSLPEAEANDCCFLTGECFFSFSFFIPSTNHLPRSALLTFPAQLTQEAKQNRWSALEHETQDYFLTTLREFATGQKIHKDFDTGGALKPWCPIALGASSVLYDLVPA